MGGVAATVSDELAEAFSKNFEKGMNKFFDERSADVSDFLRDMAKYFVQFEPSDGNLYGELIKLLGYHRNKTTFVTTNYDLLIERSADRQKLIFSYDDSPDKNKLSVLKIHGSCNFLPDLGGVSLSGFSIDTGDSASDAKALSTDVVKIALSKQEVLDFCNQEDVIAPALAAYNPSKKALYCDKHVKDQQKLWRKVACEAKSIYIIGLKVHEIDVHIWGILAESKAKKYYVGFEPDEFRAWAERAGAKKCYVIGDRFKDAMPVIARHLNKKWKKHA